MPCRMACDRCDHVVPYRLPAVSLSPSAIVFPPCAAPPRSISTRVVRVARGITVRRRRSRRGRGGGAADPRAAGRPGDGVPAAPAAPGAPRHAPRLTALEPTHSGEPCQLVHVLPAVRCAASRQVCCQPSGVLPTVRCAASRQVCCQPSGVLPAVRCAASRQVCCQPSGVLPAVRCAANRQVFCQPSGGLPAVRCAASRQVLGSILSTLSVKYSCHTSSPCPPFRQLPLPPVPPVLRAAAAQGSARVVGACAVSQRLLITPPPFLLCPFPPSPLRTPPLFPPQSPLYYEMRRHRGVQEGWVYVLSRDSSDRLWWHALDVRSATWHDVPRMPSLCSRAYGLACAACQGNLYVIGGAGWLKPSRPHVYRYNPPANKWVRVADMAFPRCYCVAGAVRLERDGKGGEQGAGWLREGGDRGREGREAGDRLGDGGWERERQRERLQDGEGAREGGSVSGGKGDGERSRVEESERVGDEAGGGESSSGGKGGGSSREPRGGKARGPEGESRKGAQVCSAGGAWASERLVVAGGMGASNTSLLTSVEVYHPQEDRWTSAAPLPFECDLEDAAVLANRLLLRHMRCVHSPPGPDAVAFSLSSNSWSPLSGNLPSAWHGPSTVLDGRMYMLDQIGGIRLAVYDDVAQMWRPIGRLSPALLTPPCRILGFRGRLYVIGRGLSMVVVEVEEALRCDGVLLTRRIDGVGCPSDVVVSCVVLEL
ncbi:unnamed protein product [Closterium sp. Naga37s-1]|nr:unnamed protein product [Closterium sp. Naga37s-1]